jgi:AcrR family transcriptional regulator
MRLSNSHARPAARAVRPAKGPLGRPRDESIDAKVVAAVLELLRTRGYGAITIASVARKVNTARTNLYRRWPSKRHLVAYAVVSEMGARPAANTGALRADLEAAVQTLLRAFAGPLGKALPGLVADMAQDPDLAASIREEVLAARRQSMRQALDRAEARGEIRRDLESELLLDMLTGPFYFRALFGHAPITPRMTQSVVKYILRITARR